MREAYQDQRLAAEAAQMRAQVEEDIAHAQAIPMHEAYEARAAHDSEITEKWIDNDAANDLAEMRMFGSRGREYVDPQTGEQIAGQIVQEGQHKGERVELPSMKEQILSSPRYATAKDERKRIAKQYEDVAKELLGQGLSFSQTEAVLNHMGYGSDQAGPADRVRRLTGKFITGGNSIEDAQARARKVVDKENDKFLKETLTTEQYDKWQKRIEDRENARREFAERAEAARKKAEADERERLAAEAAAEAARKAAEEARKQAEEAEKEEPETPELPEDDNEKPEVEQPAPEEEKPEEPEDEEPTVPEVPKPQLPEPLPEKTPNAPDVEPIEPNLPLPDALRNANVVRRFIQGHPSAKVTGRLKYLAGTLSPKTRQERREVEAMLAGSDNFDQATLNEKLQGLRGIGAEPTARLLELAFLANSNVDLSKAKDLKDVERILREAQPIPRSKAGEAVDEALGGGKKITDEAGKEAARERFDLGGNPNVSEAESHYNEALIKSATIDQIADPDWWAANNLNDETMSPANMRLVTMRAQQIDKVRAAQQRQAEEAAATQQPTERRSLRERMRARRQRNQEDVTRTNEAINLQQLRDAQGNDQAQRFRILGSVRGPAVARQAANDVGIGNLSQETQAYLASLSNEEGNGNS